MQRRLRAGITSFLALALALAACQPPVVIPTTLYTPTIVGVVAAVTPPDSDRTDVYTLADGRSVTIDYAQAKVLADGGGNGSAGDLVLADESSTWIVSLRRSSMPGVPPGCFALSMAGVDDGDHIDFANGLRLPKATDFDPGVANGSKDGLYANAQVGFCIDSAGIVARYGLVPYPSCCPASRSRAP